MLNVWCRGRERLLSGNLELMTRKAAGSASSAQGSDSFPTPPGKEDSFGQREAERPRLEGQAGSTGDLWFTALCGGRWNFTPRCCPLVIICCPSIPKTSTSRPTTREQSGPVHLPPFSPLHHPVSCPPIPSVPHGLLPYPCNVSCVLRKPRHNYTCCPSLLPNQYRMPDLQVWTVELAFPGNVCSKGRTGLKTKWSQISRKWLYFVMGSFLGSRLSLWNMCFSLCRH